MIKGAPAHENLESDLGIPRSSTCRNSDDDQDPFLGATRILQSLEEHVDTGLIKLKSILKE